MHLIPKFAIFVCTFIGASTIVIAEPLIHILPPFTLLGARFLLAALLLAAVQPKKIFPLTRNAVKDGSITGLGFGGGCILLYFALPHVHAGKLTFLIALEVVLVPLICHATGIHKISKREILALLPAVIGLWLITVDEEQGFSWWEFVALLSTIAYSVYTISLSNASKAVPVICRTFVSFILIGSLSFTAALVTETITEITWTLPAAIGLLYLVSVGSLARFLLQAWAQKHVSAPFTALTFSAEPVFTSLLSYYFLSERFTTQQLCGAVAIMAAILFANFTISPSDNMNQAA